MKKTKIIYLIPFIICLAFLLSACDGEEPAETTEPTETEPAETPLYLVENGEAMYAVILPENSNGEMRTAVNSFADKLGDLYGAKFEVKKNRALAEGKKLIMIGAQEDKEYASYFADVAYRDYAMKITDDGNIVVAAWSVEAIGNCTSKLIMKLKSAFDSGDTLGLITEDILINGADTSMLDASIPQLSPGRMPRIYHIAGARGAYELCFKNSTIEDYKAYSSLLAENGYESVQKTDGADASFEVFRGDGIEVTLAFWHATSEFVAMIDKPAAVTPLSADSVNAVTVPKVIEPGLEYAGALKGMCYVIQASDGSFVIVDSGDSDPKFLDRLYSVLKENVPEGSKPRIRAWFITHVHGDHISGFVDIASSKYASLIECDAIYSNMPHESYQTAYEKSAYASRISKLEKAAKSLGADYVTARTGQTYYFADLAVQMLCSVDDMFLGEYNDLDETSIVFTVGTANKKMIFTGDAGPVVIGQYVMKRYTAATLKSDICQATSHGANHAAHTPFYQAVDPDVYLWSANTEFYNKHTPNKYIESDKSAKIIYSFDGTYTVELN